MCRLLFRFALPSFIGNCRAFALKGSALSNSSAACALSGLFGALSTTQDLFLNQQFDLTSFWVEALPALALVYLGLGVSLFEYVILE